MDYFKRVLELASKSLDHDDVPVGALVVYQNKIIGEGYNTKEFDNNILGHAEVNAILNASSTINNWNLCDCDMYVSLRPCSMCNEVIKSSRIRNVYYLVDKLPNKNEYNKSSFILVNNRYNDEYKVILNNFFSKLREKN